MIQNRIYAPSWAKTREDRAEERQERKDRIATEMYRTRRIPKSQARMLHRKLRGKRNPWLRIVRGRELDGFIAQVVERRDPCGCGNPRCDLFGPHYTPFPNYSDAVRDEFLRKCGLL